MEREKEGPPRQNKGLSSQHTSESDCTRTHPDGPTCHGSHTGPSPWTQGKAAGRSPDAHPEALTEDFVC